MTTIITKHSETATDKPTSLAVGELAVNTADGLIFCSPDGTTIKTIGGDSGGGDPGSLPSGSADGQMLRWNAAGEPTWEVTDVITTNTDDNVALGGPQFSASYKLTVNGATYLDGTLDVQDFVTMVNGMSCTQTATFGQVNIGTGLTLTGTSSMSMSGTGKMNSFAANDPINSNQVGRRGYNDTRYTLRTGGTLSGGTLTSTCNINGLPTSSGSAWFVMANVSGTMQKGGLVNGAAQVQAVLEQFAIALGATPAQMTAVQAAIAPLTVEAP